MAACVKDGEDICVRIDVMQGAWVKGLDCEGGQTVICIVDGSMDEQGTGPMYGRREDEDEESGRVNKVQYGRDITFITRFCPAR